MGAQDGTGHDEAGLEAVRLTWGDAYEIGYDAERAYWAKRRDGRGGTITARAPEFLASLIGESDAPPGIPARDPMPRALRALAGLIPGTGGYVDQVVRWEAFKAAHPSAEWTHNPPVYTGSVIIRGERAERSAHGLERLIDELEKAVAGEPEPGAPAGGA